MSNYFILFYFCVTVCFTSTIADDNWQFIFGTSNVNKVEMGNTTKILFDVTTNSSWSDEDLKIQVISTDDDVAFTDHQFFDLPQSHETNEAPTRWSFSFNLTATFIGYTKLYLRVVELENNTIVAVKNTSYVHMNIIVVRKPQLIDTIFVICVATLMSIIFINFGCALEVEQLKQCIKKPIAPGVSFLAQFILLPIVSFFYAKLIFPNSAPMQLGLFFTGISPGGGAASVWALLLGGNINLSIILTTIGTLSSFVMIPFWVVFLGNRIFSMGEMPVPYSRIIQSIVALIIPLCIGYCIQKCFPRVSKVMIRVLKPLSSCLIIFIIIFATVTNLYLFKIFTWEIMIAGAVIPWTGYLLGYLTSISTRLSKPDTISMTIESGIQNTGIAIFMLKFSLGQPAADITTVIPVAVALMTPIPLLVGFVIKKYFGEKKETIENQDPAAKSILKNNDDEVTTTQPDSINESVQA